MNGTFHTTQIHEKPLASLVVEITRQVDSWDLRYDDDEKTRRAASMKPEWCPIEWPEEASLPSTSTVTEHMMLTKMQLFFDFAVGPAEDGEPEVIGQLGGAFGQVAVSSANLATDSPSTFSTTPILVEVEMWHDGSISGRMEYDQRDSPIGESSLERNELFARQLLRLELRRRIGVLQKD